MSAIYFKWRIPSREAALNIFLHATRISSRQGLRHRKARELALNECLQRLQVRPRIGRRIRVGKPPVIGSRHIARQFHHDPSRAIGEVQDDLTLPQHRAARHQVEAVLAIEVTARVRIIISYCRVHSPSRPEVLTTSACSPSAKDTKFCRVPLTAPRLPDADRRRLPTVDREISRFPRKERLHMPGSLTTPGRPALAMTRSDVLPSTICTVSAPKIGLFRGSMAGLCAPLSTLRRDPRGPLRMTWGRCGSLLLHRKGLSPSTPCRSPGASHMFSGVPPIPDMAARLRSTPSRKRRHRGRAIRKS
jgi:hypothetical protein